MLASVHDIKQPPCPVLTAGSHVDEPNIEPSELLVVSNFVIEPPIVLSGSR